jgi:hypothetical protein
MKTRIAGILVLILMGTASWGQGTKELFDADKSREELEIMKGILDTTLKFQAQRVKPETARWRWSVSSLETFYLAGQGAVFVIPAYRWSSRNSLNFDPDFTSEMAQLSREISAASQEVAREAALQAQQALARSYVGSGTGPGTGSGVGSGTGSAQAAPPAPPPPPPPPPPPAPPAPPGDNS